MEIDTLVLSGGGINCISLLGSFKYLFENGTIHPNFKNIRTIICVSGSAFHIIPLLLNYSINMVIQLFLSYNEEIINYDNFDLNKLLIDFGLYKNNFIQEMIEKLLEKKNLNQRMTLQELFEMTNIDLIIKVVNISQNKIVYINHKSHPKIPLSVVCSMTTCIPFLFQPINYKNDLYIDGGICGNLPLDYIQNKSKYKKYLAINILVKSKEEILSIQDFLFALFVIPFSPLDHTINKKKVITIRMDEIGIQLNINKEKKIQKYNEGYKQTWIYFNGHKHIDSKHRSNED